MTSNRGSKSQGRWRAAALRAGCQRAESLRRPRQRDRGGEIFVSGRGDGCRADRADRPRHFGATRASGRALKALASGGARSIFGTVMPMTGAMPRPIRFENSYARLPEIGRAHV